MPLNPTWKRFVLRLRWERHKWRFRRSVKLLHGPKKLVTPKDAVIVVAPLRNGIYYIDEFLRYYRALGAAQFVFFDNGSTDGTKERLRQESDTIVLQSLLPWKQFQSDLRRYAALRYASKRWCLYADIDEMFDFEGAKQIGLPGLTRYLTDRGYTALVAQMLEMFPKRPLNEVANLPYSAALEQFSYYDLRQVESVPYHDRNAFSFSYFIKNNTIADTAIKFCFGGVRKRVFGEHCCLTKHPLVYVDGSVQPGIHPHCASNVVCADFTALIRHYKFANDPISRDADTISRGATGHGEDRKRLHAFNKEPDLTLFTDAARKFDGIAPLYDQGFLVSSDEFACHIDKEKQEAPK